MPPTKQNKTLWVGIAIATLSIIALAALWFHNTTKPDIPIAIKLTPPDSLRAYALKPNLLKLYDEWNTLRNAGETDSLHSLMKTNYVDTQYIGLLLLEQATLFRDRRKEQIANSKLETAREFGQDLIEVFRDSFLLKQVDHIEKLDNEQLRLRAQASEAYASACEPLYDGKYVEAQKNFEFAGNIAKRAKDDKLLIEALSLLQWFLVRDSQHQAIIELGEQIVEKAKKTGYKRRLAIALQHIAEAFREMDNDQEALVAIEKATRIAEIMNDSDVLANCYLVKAQIFYRMENYQTADEILEKLTTIDKEGNKRGKTNIHKGQICVERGEYGKAIRFYEEALEIFRQKNDKMNEAISLSELSFLQFKIGEYESALEFEKRSLQIRKSEKNVERVALSLSKLGGIYSKMDSLDKAIAYHRQALQLFQSEGKRHRTDFWLRLGDVQLKKGQMPEAKKSFATAQNLANSISYQLGKTGALIGLGRIAFFQNQLKQAKDHFNLALRITENIKESRLKAAAYFGLSQVEKKLTNFGRASQSIEKAIEAGEKLRKSIYRDSLRVSFFATTQDLFDEAILLSLAQDQKRLALHYAERARSRALLDAFYKPTIQEIEKESLEMMLETPVPSIDKLLQNIPASMQVIEYRITPDTLHIWLIKDSGLVLGKLPVSAESLTETVQNFLESIGADNLQVFQERVKKEVATVYNENRDIAKKLYRLLLDPIVDGLNPNQQLVIIPDGILHHLPFGALVTEDGHFLEERYIYTKSPSLTILYESSKLANKVFQPTSSQFLMVAGDFQSTSSQKRMVKELFTDARILEKQAANYDNLKTVLSNHRPEILYFSVHAVSDVQYPMNSYIELYENNATDGRAPPTKVYARQLLDLDFSNTQLAVLNACKSSSGKIVGGEGVLNLVRLFSLSQVPIVMASLWQNDDRRSADLISSFYEELTAGKGVAEALHQAKIVNIEKLRNVDGYPLPYFWAALESYQNHWLNHEELITNK